MSRETIDKMTKKEIDDKIQTLIEQEGFDDIMELMDQYIIDSVVPSICMNPGCAYTAETEQDATEGWCEECQTQSVCSPMILLGVI